MKKIYIPFIISSIITITSCEKLDQEPPNLQNSNSLEDYSGVLNAAYFYQVGAVTPMAVMADFRADNGIMEESPFTEFDMFTSNLTAMEDQFFGPFYTAMYRSILSANNVIQNPGDNQEIAEARFLRGLSYFKLVQVFGDVSVILDANPNPNSEDQSYLIRRNKDYVYDEVIIPDFIAAMNNLSSDAANGRASKLAAQALLGKAYMHRSDFGNAQPHLQAVVDGASGAGINLQSDFAAIFGSSNDLNSEIIFATQISSSVTDEYDFSEFWEWYGGLETKALKPLDQDLVNAFDSVANDTLAGGDFRRAVTIDTAAQASPKFPQTNGPEHDWIEIRLADVILLYAEALNENGNTTAALVELNKIRSRANLVNSTATTQTDVRQAIADERRLELAFEGHRWFDLVRTNTVDAEMGETINPNYHVFPIPTSEIFASFEVITQNPGY
jgi:hypothetical protein